MKLKTLIIIILLNTLFPNNDKIGLVLSGGGVKGLAHIGTLKIIDSLNINIDYIAGTSIGSIAAALYASGHSADEIERVCYNTNWDEIFAKHRKRNHLFYFQKMNDENFQLDFTLNQYKPTAPLGLTDGQYSYEYLSSLFNIYEEIDSFDNMVIPFRCNAVDILSGEEIIFSNGSLSKGLRASTSIPSIFSPIEHNDYLLIDGGVKNNLPTNIVKSMGAEKIIAVDVMSERKNKNEINDILDVISSTLNIYFLDNNLNNKKNADILINPKLKNINVINFDKETMDNIKNLGSKAAYQNIEAFIKLRGNNDYKKLSALDNNFIISNFEYNSNDKYLSDFFNHIKGKKISKTSFIDLIQKLRQTKKYYNISYKFKSINHNQYILYLSTTNIKPRLINEVVINGNQQLNKNELYNIFNFKKNDTINLFTIEKNINEAYSLDYFKHIFYELNHLDDNYSDLVITIKENNFKQLHLGVLWDNYYKLIGKMKIDLINKPTSNFRIQNELILSGIKDNTGIKRNIFSIYYLGNQKKILRFIPYIENINSIENFEYLNLQYVEPSIPKNSATNNSRKISAGLIIPFKSYGYIKFNVSNEKNTIRNLNVNNIINKNNIAYNEFTLNIDQLDNLTIPKYGYKVILSNSNIINKYSDSYSFSKQYFEFNYYKTYNDKHTIRTYGALRKINGFAPIHIKTYYGGYNWAIGYDEFDLYTNELFIIGAEYHFHYKNSTTFKLILNKIPHIKFDYTTYYIPNNLPLSYGLGISFKSILGPINLTWARGLNNPYNPNPKMGNIFYFNFGVNY